MSLKQEFIQLALEKPISFSQLCKRFNISRTTGYKWINRYQLKGNNGLEELSRKPKHSPNKTPQVIEELVCQLRRKQPAWGARKIYQELQKQGFISLPAPSTINAILKRHGLNNAYYHPSADFIRFEKEHPNDLWQMDFKGHFPLAHSSRRCHPLTMLDDHSRYNLCLEACANEQAQTVKDHLITVFRRYGLPKSLLADNGSP